MRKTEKNFYRPDQNQPINCWPKLTNLDRKSLKISQNILQNKSAKSYYAQYYGWGGGDYYTDHPPGQVLYLRLWLGGKRVVLGGGGSPLVGVLSGWRCVNL